MIVQLLYGASKLFDGCGAIILGNKGDNRYLVDRQVVLLWYVQTIGLNGGFDFTARKLI